jgi:hypothetical protein
MVLGDIEKGSGKTPPGRESGLCHRSAPVPPTGGTGRQGCGAFVFNEIKGFVLMGSLRGFRLPGRARRVARGLRRVKKRGF